MGVTVVAVFVAGFMWLRRQRSELPAAFASGNGRIEATEYDIATKRAGRIVKVLAAEGDMVETGQVIVQMDTADLEATLHQAEAELRQAREDKKQALAVVTQRESDIKQALAAIAQRESELAFATKEFERSDALLKKELISKQQYDQDQTRKQMAEAALAQEQARKQTAEGALRAAQIQINVKDATIDAAVAAIHQIKADIADSILKSPIRGRILYRLGEPGEVLAAGGKVLTVLELTDVYMTMFLPTAQAGRVTVGSEARIVLDAAPQYVIPATVSFVASRSQFTPKEVETRTEREKLMFRIKVKIDPELLKKHLEKVKTGMPGVAYVRLDADAAWPDHLQVRLPQ